MQLTDKRIKTCSISQATPTGYEQTVVLKANKTHAPVKTNMDFIPDISDVTPEPYTRHDFKNAIIKQDSNGDCYPRRKLFDQGQNTITTEAIPQISTKTRPQIVADEEDDLTSETEEVLMTFKNYSITTNGLRAKRTDKEGKFLYKLTCGS